MYQDFINLYNLDLHSSAKSFFFRLLREVDVLESGYISAISAEIGGVGLILFF